MKTFETLKNKDSINPQGLFEFKFLFICLNYPSLWNYQLEWLKIELKAWTKMTKIHLEVD